MNKTLHYIIFNFFFALLLWKGVEGSKAAQYIFSGFHWLGVVVLAFSLGSLDKITTVKKNFLNKRNHVSEWIKVPVTLAFIVTLVWYGWIWTSLAVILEYCLVIDYKAKVEEKYEELLSKALE